MHEIVVYLMFTLTASSVFLSESVRVCYPHIMKHTEKMTAQLRIVLCQS